MQAAKILILETSTHSNRLNKDQFRKWGFEVTQRICDENVLQEVLRMEPQLIFVQTDNEDMPKLLACIKHARLQIKLKETPIVVQLPDKGNTAKESLFQAGVTHCLLEPVSETELKECVNNLLKQVELKNRLEMTQRALEESLHKVNRQRAELDHHLTLAAKIQESLIPQNLIQVPFCNFYCHFQPSGKVGGDIYDIFMLDDRHMGLYMVDVMGHGVASSMLAVALSEFLVVDVNRGTPLKRELDEAPYYEIVSPVEVIHYLNKRFSFTKYQHYFTIFYMVFNVETGELRYVRGAHPEPLLMRQDQTIETLNAYGTPIGFEFSQGYEEGTLQLQSGDRLLVYSDGLLELEDDMRQPMDYDKLQHMAGKYLAESNGQGRPFAMKFKQMVDHQSRLKDDLTMIEMVWQP
ncbi:SpoIIE family protein phosphatase [Anoxynatronum buryatiense]|uniref:Stage 0 sporulation protein A homolog n=1 Tax=Anoxynatronum buryatiense TaxID=489973 RepID=A0AA46AHS9_9CLOT|nr:SpoIIE family protein phosphatase [Anoxynatronum buryatiense]SMP41559.1 sigma-B regulation protein RsbU (phosphoserine phosphatase) [Anoxynatronum buryatiense]